MSPVSAKHHNRAVMTFAVAALALLAVSCAFVAFSDDSEVDAANVRYSVTFNGNGGSGVPSSMSEYSEWGYVDFIIPDTIPTRPGYSFMGWGEDTQYVWVLPGDYYSVYDYNNPATLYAIWGYEYKVNFNANGGSGAPESVSYVEYTDYSSASVKIPDNVPTRNGYTFLGWSDRMDGDVLYLPGDYVSFFEMYANTEITLYAIWAEGTTNGEASFTVECTGTGTEYVTYNGTRVFEVVLSATVSGENVSYRLDVTKLTSFARGYVIYGYYSDPYELNNAGAALNTHESGSITDSSWPVGSSRSFTNMLSDAPRDDWFTDMTLYFGVSSTTSGDRNDYPGTQAAEFVVSYKQVILWDFTTTVTFDDNGGSNGHADIVVTESMDAMNPGNKTITIPNTAPVSPSGLSFLGWSTTSSGEVAYEMGKSYQIPYGSTLNLYARWGNPSSTVTFMSNGSPYESVIVLNGSTCTPPEDPTLYGYSFKGWFTDDVTFQNEFDFSEVINSDLTLYAKWEGNLEFTTDPIADGIVTAVAGSPGTVYFSATPSQDYTSVLWDFGDGSEPSDSTYVTHYYSQPGTYTAKLTVYNNYGEDTTEFIIEVPEDGSTGGGRMTSFCGLPSGSSLLSQEAWSSEDSCESTFVNMEAVA